LHRLSDSVQSHSRAKIFFFSFSSDVGRKLNFGKFQQVPLTGPKMTEAAELKNKARKDYYFSLGLIL
jgi:hypothetical protein